MPKSKTLSKGFKSFLGPLVAPGSPSAALRSGTATTRISTPKPKLDLVLKNLATAYRITMDVAEALDNVPYVKAVTGVISQIVNIYEEVQGNKERCNAIISIVTQYAYTVIECLAELYTVEGEHRLEALKGELRSFQSYLETVLLEDLEPLKNQSHSKAYAKRDNDADDMSRIENGLKGFVDRFTMKAVTVGVSAAVATKPILTEIQQALLRDHWLRSQHAQYNIDSLDASPNSVDRAHCAPATREPVLERITTWACDRNPGSPAVFWMVGEGGVGKSTIARTIAKKFDEDTALPAVATFFCSRRFPDTNRQVYIIPTLAYQLARLCRFYSAELLKDANIVDSLRVVSKQMDSLLIQPWEVSSNHRSLDTPLFLVIIDALDEIVPQEEGDGTSGGFTFLKSLLAAVEQGHLKGIKFFVTSRPHPEMSEVCGSLPSDAICRLYDIPTNQVKQDICRYLHHRLPKLQKPEDHELLERIATKADGLFIFASTAVLVANPMPGTSMKEQRQALKGLLDELPLGDTTTSPINNLYCQILTDAFEHRNGTALSDRMDLLHTIICTEDRVTIDILVNLALKEDDDEESMRELIEDLLHRLHAVLWISDGRITWYHASFLDFLLSPASASIPLPGRILDASCNVHLQHMLLAHRCFHIMRSDLKFNICQLPSSFLLDSEVEDLAMRVEDHISQVLRYACRYWAIHASKAPVHELRVDIERFLDNQLLFWIEAMNLLQQSSLCSTLLSIVQQHAIQYYSDALDLCKQLSAAMRVSTVFIGSRASKSTPHLYLSTLVSIAPHSPLLRKWRARFSRLPNIHTRGIGTQLLMTLDGHTALVYSVAFSPDGTRIVSGSHDCSVRIWDTENGEETNRLSGHTGPVSSVTFSSDGTRVASGSNDSSVRLWDVQTGEEITKLSGHTDNVNSVAFSSDCARIASGSGDWSIRIWSAETAREIKKLMGHTESIGSVAFSYDGTRIVSGSNDCSVRIWDVETGENIKTLNGHMEWVRSVSFSSDGTCIVSGSDDGSARIWDVEKGEEIKKLIVSTEWVNSVALSSDGALIVSGADDRSVRVWDVATGMEVKKLNGHAERVNSVAFSSDGTRIVSGSSDYSVRVWSAKTAEETKPLSGHADSVDSVAFSYDGTRIASGADDCSVRIWDSETGDEVKELNGHTSRVNSVAFSFNGSRIVSGSDDCSIRVWDVETGEQIKIFHGSTVPVNSVAFSREGTRIASGSYDWSVWVWSVETGEEITRLDGHTDRVNSVTFTSDGSRIVSGSSDFSVRVWDVERGEEIMKLTNHTNWVSSVDFSSDNTRIVSASWDRSIRVWDVGTGVEIKKLDGHTNWANTAAFSSDGSYIVSGSNDCSVRVWDVEKGMELMILDGHRGSVYSVAFSPGNRRIASASWDKSIRFWDVELPKELQKPADSTAFVNENTPHSRLMLPKRPLHQFNWTVNEDGWIVQLPTMNKIIWLPDTLSAYLYRPANTLIISEQTVMLDLVGAELGLNWRLCYET